MSDYPIKLGKKLSDSLSVKESPSSDETHYPSLYIDFDGDDAPDFPKTGTMTVKFRLRSESEKTRNGKTTCSYEFDILSVESVKGGAEKKDEESSSDALDRLKNESENEEDDGDE